MITIPPHLAPFVKIKTCRLNIGFNIFTYSVIPTNSTGVIPKNSYGALDDNTYIHYPELVKLIPRGFSIVTAGYEEICRLDGLQKFDGSCPLDDDDECENIIFKENINKVKEWKNLQVEFQEKANGKMAIFKLFKWNNKLYILGGSKNVHVVVGLDDDIINPKAELHYEILRLIQTDIHNYKNIDELLNKTIIGEYVDGQHIVYTDKKYMAYFSGPLCDVKLVLETQNTLPTLEQLTYIRNLENTEGVVIKYLNMDTGEIFRQKHKTIWYILIRAMRECLKHFNKNVEVNIIHSEIYSIFKKRSNDFLNLTPDQLEKWSNIANSFIIFIKNSRYSFHDLDMQQIGIGKIYNEFLNSEPRMEKEIRSLITLHKEELIRDDSWLVVLIGDDGLVSSSLVVPTQNEVNKVIEDHSKRWRVFGKWDLGTHIHISAPDAPCQLTSISTDPVENLSDPELINYVRELYNMGIKTCIIMRGNSGSGKTTIVDKLSKLMDLKIYSTDSYFYKDGNYMFEKDKLCEYHNLNFDNFKKGIKNNQLSICVDNTNINFSEYVRYLEYARNYGYVTIFLQFKYIPVEILVSRSQHKIPIQVIRSKLMNYKIVSPVYYGIFIPNEYLLEFDPIQTTPLHITLAYGKKEIEELTIKTGTKFNVTIKSIIKNVAGRCLLVDVDYKTTKMLHITLETFKGYKPVDVGKFEPIEITTVSKTIEGIFGPIY